MKQYKNLRFRGGFLFIVITINSAGNDPYHPAVPPKRDGYDIDYIKYSLELSLQQLKRAAQGSQTKFLTMQILESFQVLDLPYEKQKLLVGSIREIDRKIIINNRINDNLYEQPKSHVILSERQRVEESVPILPRK